MGEGPCKKGDMQKLLTRGLFGVAALSAPLGAALVLPAAAHAASGGGSTTAAAVLATGSGTGPNPYNGTINANLDVPAGASLVLNGATVTGNVTVEGYLFAGNTHFDKNVIVTGGVIQFNNQPYQPSIIKGNLNITSPSTSDDSGFWVPTTIGGNFNYYGSSAHLYMGAAPTVGGQANISTY
jgi:hypothetical protein